MSPVLRTGFAKKTLSARAITLILLVTGMMACTSCHSKSGDIAAQPVTITFIGWGPATLSELTADQSELSQFTKQSGIQVKFIVGPESMTDRLQLYLDALERGSSTPDVLYTDVVWPGVLAEYAVDLWPYAGEDAKRLLPFAVQNGTVGGRLVALPFSVDSGLLYYRTDLLAKYGFAHPPETWDELAGMARRIQAGERAAGRKDFWGYIWQGAAYEGLTCNAMEWQMSSGGGKIIEDDGTISVNNPQTVKALKMAKSWVGSISPPSVLAFKEADVSNIWDAGNAAFRRDWVWRGNSVTKLTEGGGPGRFGMSLPPSGGTGHASVLGGQGLMVSKYSAHPREAAELVRYLTSRDVQIGHWHREFMLPVVTEFYRDPQYLASRPDLERIQDIVKGQPTTRPSTVSGRHYAEVSRAYYTAVHSVLTGEVTAEKAMADLEAELVGITGFKAGKPSQTMKHSGGVN
jgi:trehalose/maltose transport system substrate-binding protein